MSDTKVTLNSAESWKAAKAYADTIGYVPIVFSTTVRFLVTDSFKCNDELRPVVKYQVSRLLRSDSLKSMIYHASKVLHHDKLKVRDNFNIGDLVNFYTPFDLASLIGIFVLFKKVRKLCPEAAWPQVLENMREESRRSAAIGLSIPAIGIGIGFLVGTLRHLAMVPMIKHDPGSYNKYRRAVARKGVMFDDHLEVEMWGATSMQVASIILSSLGFGAKVADSFVMGMNPKLRVQNSGDEHFAYRVGMAKLWRNSVLREGKIQPDMNIPGEYYPLETAQERYKTTVAMCTEDLPHWMERTAADIGAVQSPELFSEAEEEGEYEVPEELSDIFSVEELSSMEEEDFDTLLDKIENDNLGKNPDETEKLLEEDAKK